MKLVKIAYNLQSNHLQDLVFMTDPLITRSNLLSSQTTHKELHKIEGQYIKSMVFGGLDGCINSLVLILSGIASLTDATQIMTLCIATVVGDAIGMGLGDYLSARAQHLYTKTEQQRQLYEVQHSLNDEKKQIIDIYVNLGYPMEDADRLSDLYATNSQAFVNIMMLEELGLVVGQQSDAKKFGFITFLSFMIFGGIPAVPYIISCEIAQTNEQQPFPVIFIGVVLLFSLGWAKAALIGLKRWKSGLQTLILGSIITAIGFGIGILFRQ